MMAVAIVPIEFLVVPPLEIGSAKIWLVGGDYANDAFVLRGDWFCGGPLVVQAGSDAGRRSRHSFPVSGSAVRGMR